MKNTIIVKKSHHDKFYTNPTVARFCVKQLQQTIKNQDYTFLEPSAGGGVFVDVLREIGISNIDAIDINPEYDFIKKQDFFTYKPSFNNKIIVIGNPPFGRCSSLAIKFFNHAASFQNTEIIAYILPKTFRKYSVQNRLSNNFGLVEDFDLPKNSFLLDGNINYDVPCIFQIWKKLETPRHIYKNRSLDLIQFVQKEDAEFAIRRVGGRAGQLLDGMNYNYNSTYFCKENKKGVKKALQKIDFSEVVNSTAGVRSLSKMEIQIALEKYFKENGEV
jgi:hypothetical protein